MTDQPFEIPGSARRLDTDGLKALNADQVEGQIDLSEDIQVTVLLPADPEAADPPYPTTRDALRESRRPRPADVQRVIGFANDNGLEVVDADRPPRMVVLHGTVGNFTKAFGTDVDLWDEPWPQPSEQINPQQQSQPRLPFRKRLNKPLTVPAALSAAVQGVFGIDDRKEARMQMHVAPRDALMQMHVAPRDALMQMHNRLQGLPAPVPPDSANQPEPGTTLRELAGLYEFPDPGLTGDGQTIAILSLGGRLGPDKVAQYEVKEVVVDGALPEPHPVLDEDAEVALDVYIIAALAPSARIVIYYAENTSQGVLNGLAQAIYSDDYQASIICITWGMYEESWTVQAMRAIDELLADAKALGITVCCASGDMKSSDGAPDRSPHVDFPASSPHVLSCGGTMLKRNPEGQDSLEVVWDESETFGSGGGESTYFGKPDWQRNRCDDPELGNLTMRGVPDVASFADPSRGFSISVGGQEVLVGGTSAAAPLWAGLIACINEKLGKSVGYLNPLLYLAVSRDAFLDIMEGNNITDASNPKWNAKNGWDACTGLGRPRGDVLLQELQRLLGPGTASGT
jgi:kumamolisin